MENQDVMGSHDSKGKKNDSSETEKSKEDKTIHEKFSEKKRAESEKEDEAYNDVYARSRKSGQSENETDLEEQKVEETKSEEDSFKSKYIYLAAEIENYKKRIQKEKENLLKFGNEKILLDLIDVMDNFERTIDALKNEDDEKIKNILTGIDMVKKQFVTILQKHGLVTVDAVGKEFDPNFHEAVSQKQVEGDLDQVIIEEYQKGYLLNGRLIRPSKVVVARTE